jgi:hypothetical protein
MGLFRVVNIMRKVGEIIKIKYFISNKNGCMIFKDVDGKGYTGVWSCLSYSYKECPKHPYSSPETFKCFWFGESTFRKIREYHINNRLFEIDYKWLRSNFKVDW